MITMQHIEGINDIPGIGQVPLNLQDVLLTRDGGTIGMAHLGNKGIILNIVASELRPEFEKRGWFVLTTSEPLVLSLWVEGEGLETCAVVINDRKLPKDGDFCYFIPFDAKVVDGGFIPSVVYANKPGYSPMTGGPDQAPWVWGPTYEDAEACAREKNKRMGLTEKDVDKIIASSMVAQNTED